MYVEIVTKIAKLKENMCGDEIENPETKRLLWKRFL